MEWLEDRRIECWSVMRTMTVGEYLNFVKEAHKERGGLPGQRDVLKTTTAKRVHERMIADIRQGAILPPVVIGAVVGSEDFAKFPVDDDLERIIPDNSQLAIIDGMQRTASLEVAMTDDPGIADRKMRVELWLTRSVRAMIYRMLVLNTGQIPWTLNRQLSVVYAPLLAEIRKNVPEIEKITSPDNTGRRVGPAQYASDDLVELYLGFSLRKTTVDTKEALSEEFSRLDFVDNLADAAFQEQFYATLTALAKIDKAFSKYESENSDRFSKGRHIFDGQPARIGFVVALGQHLLGRAGQDKSKEERASRTEKALQNVDRFTQKLGEMDEEGLTDFLRLPVLAELLSKKVGQVGRFERNFFFEGFKLLVTEEFEVPTMEGCWRAA